MHQSSSIRKQSGQSLLEIIVAVGVAMLLITGLVVGSTVSLRTSQYGQSRSIATKYAQEGMELVRSLRDSSDWDTFTSFDADPASGATTRCFGDDQTLTLIGSVSDPCDPNIGETLTFTRSATFEWNNRPPVHDIYPQVEVTVVVSWLDGNQTKDVTLKTYFTQWR